MSEKIEKHSNKIFLLILLIAILVRLMFISQTPNGIHEDEAGMAYDAWCISEYGVDRYLNHNPVYLINFGGGQSALYAYLAAICIKVFGFSLFAVRLPAILFSIITIILSYYIVKKRKSTKLGLLFAFLIAICPWHIMQSRWGLDCNLLSSFIAIDLFLLLSSSKSWHFLLTGITIGITLYTYALSYIMLPCFLFVLFIYLLYTKKITWKNILVMAVPIIILAIPLVLVQIVNFANIGTLDLGFITIPHLPSYRISEIGFQNILPNLNIIKANNIFQLLFGYDHNEFNSFSAFGTMYYLLIPFIIYGFYLLIKQTISDIKKKDFRIDTVFLIQFVTIFICVLLFSDLQLYKLNALFIPCLYFAAIAISKLLHYSKIVFIMVVIILSIFFGLFTYYYFTNINTKMGVAFNNDLIPLVHYINSKEEYASKSVHIESDGIQQYIYVLLAQRISPYDFYHSVKIAQSGYNTYEVIAFGKYTFLTYDEIRKDTIYVVENTNYFRQKSSDILKQKLEEANFQKEEWNGFSIYYMNNT